MVLVFASIVAHQRTNSSFAQAIDISKKRLYPTSRGNFRNSYSGCNNCLPNSDPAEPGYGPGTDKLYHFIAFATLVFPCSLLFARTLIWVLPAALLFGGAIELIQPYVGRGGELADLVADALSVFVGAAHGLTLRAIVSRPATTSAPSVWWVRIFQ